VWQERERIGGHQVQKRWENDGIVGYIQPELVLPNSILEVDSEAGPGASSIGAGCILLRGFLGIVSLLAAFCNSCFFLDSECL
jgi:hypothetical protein